jgi:GTP-binding protein
MDDEIVEQARKLFAGPVAFLKSAPKLEFLPPPDYPEVAFAGRSNVGKSSLLNALANRNGLARTSNTPGRTQELNFFDVGDPIRLRLVDMPGYGFAEAPKDVVKKWRFLINDYLRGRQVLSRGFVLIDSYRVVMTKADKVKATELEAVATATETQIRKRPAAHPDLILTSSEKGMGLAELRAAVLEAVEAHR